jgi:predicted transcriptional regulator
MLKQPNPFVAVKELQTENMKLVQDNQELREENQKLVQAKKELEEKLQRIEELVKLFGGKYCDIVNKDK